MRTAHVFWMVMCLAVAAAATAGDVRVTCAPGLNIFVDGDFIGVSTPKYDGKYLTGLSSGEHTIMIKKVGFSTKEFTVAVGTAPLQIVVGELVPSSQTNQPETTERDAVGRRVGTIEVTSNPQECSVEIAGQIIAKHEPLMTIPRIPVGDYDIRFESSGEVLSTTVVVRADETSRIEADILNNQVKYTADTSDDGENGSTRKKDGSKKKRACVEYWVEVVRTSDPEIIEATRPKLKELGFPVYHQKLITIEDDGALPLYKLRIGPIPHKKDANRITFDLQKAGFTAAWLIPEACQ